MLLSSSLLSLFAGCIINDNPGINEGFDTGLGTGTVEVAWQVGASGCELAGVEEVVITIGSAERAFDCDLGRGTLTAPEGVWDLLADGVDGEGVSRYEGIAPGVRVMADSVTSAGLVTLQARTGDIDLTWQFDNGRLCGPNGVSTIDVTLFQSNRIRRELTTTCDDGRELVADVEAGAYDVSVLANDQSGFPLFDATSEAVVLEGETTLVDIVLIER